MGWVGVLYNSPDVFDRNYAPAGFDRRHSFTLAYAYQLPFGGEGRTTLLKLLVKDWQWNGTFAAYSGTPFTVTASNTSLDQRGNQQTADLIGELKRVSNGVDEPYYDTSAFANVTEQRYGNTGRNQFYGPGYWNYNTSLFRTFPLQGRKRLQVRVEGFSVTNGPQWSNPNNSVTKSGGESAVGPAPVCHSPDADHSISACSCLVLPLEGAADEGPMIAILLWSLYFAQRVEDVSTVLNEAARRFDDYREHGQLPTERNQLIQFLDSQQARFGRNSDFLRVQSRYLASVGELAASRTAFAKIPDEDLTDPNEVVLRLEDRYREDPELAIPIAIRLASLRDGYARELFVKWIHGALALDFAPQIKASSQTIAHERFLGALSKPRDSFAANVSAALRMWIDAQRTSDPSRLATLMDTEFTEPLSLGPRYQLLLYNLIERKSRSEAVILAARRRRHELMEVLISVNLRGAYGPGRERQRIRYWCAFGRNVETELARRIGARLTPTMQDAADCSTHSGAVPIDPIWTEEMRALGGRREYATPLAEFMKTLGRFDLELHFRTYAARADSSALPALADAHSRVHPGDSFDTFWQMERFKFALTLPELVVDDASGTRADVSSGRWRLLKVWSTSCLACVQQLPVLESLAQEFVGAVLLFDLDDTPSILKAYKTVHGVTLPFATFTSDAELRLQAVLAPATLIIAPDRRSVVLDEADWESEARYWLSFGNPVR